jgi:hypothetical protein
MFEFQTSGVPALSLPFLKHRGPNHKFQMMRERTSMA